MSRAAAARHKPSAGRLEDRYPPSEPCACGTCLNFCSRPGWWTVNEARKAAAAGYDGRLMLEVSPERTVAVLAPAFKGCEGFFALDSYKDGGCTFLIDNRCELHGTGFQPLECRFCHHARMGLGEKCHLDIEKDWDTPEGRALVIDWMKRTGLWKVRHLCQLKWLK